VFRDLVVLGFHLNLCYTGPMDKSLKEFRQAVQLALKDGDESLIATPVTQKRLANSPGWKSAKPQPRK
jgi:hypothetical protein